MLLQLKDFYIGHNIVSCKNKLPLQKKIWQRLDNVSEYEQLKKKQLKELGTIKKEKEVAKLKEKETWNKV